MNRVKIILIALIATVFLPLSLYGQDAGKEARFIIDFRHDDTSFDHSYLDNSASLKALTEFLKSVEADSVKTITVTGWASPEGIYERNMMLSRKRARAGANLIKERFPKLSGKITTETGGESWGLLRERILADGNLSEHSYRRILKFLDEPSISDETRKWRLKNWLGYDSVNDQLWLYLLRKHYRFIRGCEFKIVYNGPKEMPSVVWEDAPPPPAEEQPSEEPPAAEVVTDTLLTEQEVPEEATVLDTLVTVSDSLETVLDTLATPQIEEISEQTVPDETVPEQEIVEQEITEPAGEEPYDRKKKPARRHPLSPILGISTNLLYDITYIPNYGLTSIPSFSVEYYPKWGNWSAGFDVEWPMWQHPAEHRYMQINNVTVFSRYYFNPEQYRFNRGYVFGNINGARYGIGWDKKGWEGEGMGISAGAGWKFTFGRFFVDLGAAVGFFYSRYDPYVWGDDSTGWYYYDYTDDPLKFETRRMVLQWLNPTRIYISIGYDKYNRRRK